MQAHGGSVRENLRIFPEVEHHRQAERHNLANHRGNRRAGHSHGGNAQTAKNEQGIQYNVQNRAYSLGHHGEHGPACGLEQSLKDNLPKMPKENRVQIRKYCTPPVRISGISVWT